MTEVRERKCDVLIIGAGFAGGCLARQLRLEQPDLEITVIDKKTEFDWWVGESTNEPFDDYAQRILKLGPYLTGRHYPKHGLRFFFDSKDKDLPLAQMSELGRGRYSTLMPSYQLDRKAFDTDLCEINRKSGVEVLLGTRVLDGGDGITIDAKGGHVVQTSAGPIRCRWLIDAGGRAAPLVQKFDLIRPETRNNIDCYWARYTDFTCLDELGDDEWRRRVGFTQRYLSTNHFMYDGYWIWHIPVSHDIVSIGAAMDRSKVDTKVRNPEELTAFLHQHRVFRDILGPKSKALDFMGIKQLARCAKTFFSEDRWFLTGMSAMFVDPFLSNTSSVLIVQNRFIDELIRADRAGDASRYSRLLRHFNVFMHRIFNSLNNEITQFHRFGSFDVVAGWQTARDNNFFTHVVPLHTYDYRPYIESVASHADDCGCSVEVSMREASGTAADAALGVIADEFEAYLRERELYYARNTGYFSENTARFSIQEKLYQKTADRAASKRETSVSYEACFRYFVRRMGEIEGVGFNEAAFAKAFDPNGWRGKRQSLAEVFAAMRDAGEPAGDARKEDVRWWPKGPVDAYEAEHSPWYAQFTDPEGREI